MAALHDNVLKSLTHLRRYALLTSDSRQTADENVRIAMQYLFREKTSAQEAKLAMFATYQAVRSSLTLLGDGNQAKPNSDRPAGDKFADMILNLPLADRQALILVDMEDFTESEAAYILDCGPADVAEHRLHAKAAVASALEPVYKADLLFA